MGKFYGLEIKTELFKVNSNVAQLPSGSFLKIGGQGYNLTTNLQVDINSTGTGGLDTGIKEALTFYNVFAVVDSGNVVLIASKNNIPSGYNSANLIGRLRTDSSNNMVGASVKEIGAVGDVKESRLTEEQFVLENGIGWMMYDGSDITGKKLSSYIGANVLEDARGVFRRAKNNGRDAGTGNASGEVALGTAQSDRLGTHDHQSIGNLGSRTRVQGYASSVSSGLNAANVITNVSGTVIRTDSVGEAETNPRNITVNVFIKVD